MRYAQGRPAEAKEPGEPFDVQQYVDLLHEANTTASESGELAGRIERVLPQSAAAARDAAAGISALMNRAFVLLLALIIVASASVLLAELAYRAIGNRAGRMTSGSAPKRGPLP